jgi:hypothetical protein
MILFFLVAISLINAKDFKENPPKFQTKVTDFIINHRKTAVFHYGVFAKKCKMK